MAGLLKLSAVEVPEMMMIYKLGWTAYANEVLYNVPVLMICLARRWGFGIPI